jgi:hypothetical protein
LATLLCAGLYIFALTPGFLLTMLPVWGGTVLFAGLIFGLSERLPWVRGSARRLATLPYAVSLVLSAGVLYLTSSLYVPIEPVRPQGGNAAFSLCATPSDLARLASEIMAPHYLSAQTDREMLTPQVHARDGVAWGLGVGLYDGPPVSFSQWGSNIGYEGLLVGIPSRHIAVVVLANASGNLPLLRRIAQKILGVATRWSIADPAKPS